MPKATDMEMVLFYQRHIEEPCVEPRTGKNLRDFYIREATRILPTLTNPVAKSMLEETIEMYKK